MSEKKIANQARLCADCRRQTEWRQVSQEFEHEGLRVRISGIPAMVCPDCGAVSYPAGVPNKLLKASRALFDLIQDQHRGALRAEPLPC